MHGPEEGVSEHTDEANSAVKIVGGNVFVELAPDHPGFQDDVPYNLTVVELDEGPRVTTILRNIENEDIHV